MKVKDFRVKHKFSQRALARLLKVNYRTVQFWEAGERQPHPMTLMLLERLDKEMSA